MAGASLGSYQELGTSKEEGARGDKMKAKKDKNQKNVG
jgi:hypothetical protein